ncbi:hypothetical protein P168DRAFT_293044 [Aspergillus campestris IBT 28561]|uniref:Zinc finger C2H2 LYAR-type domain-containing protein n=1 Tax=Aspergillus campestris (strain IBT 28561) TaxID=1392248 RepID=A0A2I1CUD3_ASPC2|nr:uncharacterized protein P168DRAFT_293044 [Aspergillus campestris IBT 28561]PKY01224.1 hypothetical protein P168DRAFT_293044 [Aspergillus campestris IBT 28561]
MVSFSCENCGDILTKKKLDPHRNRCRGCTFTCIDCMTHFWGTEYRSHTTCMTEAQKYEGSLYKPKPEKNQRRNNNNNNNNSNNNQGTNNSKQAPKPSNGHRAPYVEDAPDADNAASKAAPPPPAPTPPPTDTKKPTHATPRQKGADPVNVFDFLVTSETPNASKVSVGGPKEQMKMVDHAPSVFETGQAMAELGADADDGDDDDDDKNHDVAYKENGFSYGSGPIPPSVYANKAAPTVSMEFMTPAPKKKKDRSSRTADGAVTTSDKKRKRRTDDHGRDNVDTPMGEAPSSVVNHPGTPMLNHSGLTGGLNRMLRSPSLDGEAGDGPSDHPRRRYQDPSSPIKRTRRDDKEPAGGDAGLGISMKNRAGRLVSSMFGGSVASTSSNGTDPAARSAARSSRRRGSSDDGQSAAADTRSSKKTSRVRGAPVAAPDDRKSKRKSSAPIDGDRPSRRLREIEHPDSAPRGEDGHQMIVYGQPNHPDALQQEMASHFLSLVTKGPESGRGFSMNKVLKRFHRDVTDEFDADRGRETGRSRADRERRLDDEKELWRTLRVKQNERGEIVLFF